MIIAHDLGTTGNKASLHEADGTLLRAVTIGYEPTFAAGGRAEQDPDVWWNAVVQATQKLLAETGVEPSAVQGLVVGGQMMGAVLLDGSYAPVRPALIWADHRSVAQSDELAGAFDEQEAYAMLGHRINPTYSLSKVMWVRDNEPEVFSRVRHVCLAKDYVVHRLTGRLATDHSDASATNAYEQATGTWSERMLAAARIDPALFPEILKSTDVVGPLTAAAAAATGLGTATSVVMGGGDGPVAAVGAGVVSEDDQAYVYLGSSSWVQIVTAAPLIDPLRRTMTFDHVIDGKYVPTATMQAGGASLQWAVGLFSDRGEKDRFDRLIAEAAGATASESGLYFLPHLLGERSPYWSPQAAGGFVGLEMHHGRANMVRSVLEGVAFNLGTCVNAFNDAGAAISRVDAIGGGAASDTWLQIMADVWGVTVRRRSIVEEANSLGAAVTASVGLGLVDDFSVARDLSRVTAEFQPDREAHERYTAGHHTFLEAYGQLEPWFPTRRGKH